MDWQGSSPERNKTVEIAVIKVEATVPVTDKRYGGAVVMNPGGPGGSGIRQVIGGGHHLRTLLSAGPEAHGSNAKYFDIIGFDPRGVNHTTPLLTCFPDHIAAARWEIERRAYGSIDTSDTSFDNLWAGSRAMAEGCSERAMEGIASHMSTAPVVRDVIEIFERHGEWREKEAARLLNKVPKHHISLSERKAVLERTAYHRNEEKVQYWGFSYGSLLGATISSMFPDRIRRVILDGVVDFPDYMAAGWTTNLQDTDRQFGFLAEYCYKGGPANCPIYDKRGPAAIASNVQKIMTELTHNPIIIPGNDTSSPAIVTHSDLATMIYDIVYNPLREFPVLAQVLQELSKGQAPTLRAWNDNNGPPIGVPLSPDCTEPYSRTCNAAALDKDFDWSVSAAITCSDGLPRTNQTKEEYREYADSLIAESALIGREWATIMMPCTAWKARPVWRYDGNFTNTTAHPILFIGNTVDPVTPLRNAFAMAKRYEGAGLLHQNSEGHCSTASISLCTGRAIREYFQSGELPGKEGSLEGYSGKGAFCEPSRIPFDGYTGDADVPLPDGEKDEELWKALVGLHRQ